MVESRLRREPNLVPHRGRHAARRHHLADAGEHDPGRIGATTWKSPFQRGGADGARQYRLKGQPHSLCGYFIITGPTKDVLENEVRPSVEQFLRDRGLQLSPEKTCITSIEEGFDFLGQNLRKYDGKLLIKPSKKNTHAFLEKVRTIIQQNRTATQESADSSTQPRHPGLGELSPIHRGGGDVRARWIMCYGKVSGAGPNADIRISRVNG